MVPSPRRLALAACLAAALSSGCGKKDGAERPTDSSGGAEAPAPGETSEDARRLLAAVPGDAAAVAVFDLPRPLWEYGTGGAFLPMKAEFEKALDEELRAYLEPRLGLDLSAVRAVVVFVQVSEGAPKGALLIGGVKGELAGGPVVEVLPEEDVVASMDGDLLITGDRSAVEAARGVSGGAGLDKAQPAFAQWIEAELEGAVFGLAVEAESAGALLGGKNPLPGLERAALAVSGGRLHLALAGDGETLATVATQLGGLKGMGLARLEAAKASMTAEGEPQALGALAIAQYHTAANMLSYVEPEVKDGRLVLTLPVELGADPTVIISMIGIGAAVAIPAFMKYIRKSKAAEAQALLRKLGDGARMHHAEHGSFPPSAPVTPPKGTCCAAGSKCPPDLAAWNTEAWKALHFSVDDPHYFSYEFENRGDEFVARAYGDLDCDGVYSTFELRGTPDSLSPVSADNELE